MAQDVTWKGLKCYHKGKLVGEIVEDNPWPNTFSIRWPDGSTTDLMNIHRARDLLLNSIKPLRTKTYSRKK
jgi:hypothetical protein